MHNYNITRETSIIGETALSGASVTITAVTFWILLLYTTTTTTTTDYYNTIGFWNAVPFHRSRQSHAWRRVFVSRGVFTWFIQSDFSLLLSTNYHFTFAIFVLVIIILIITIIINIRWFFFLIIFLDWTELFQIWLVLRVSEK